MIQKTAVAITVSTALLLLGCGGGGDGGATYAKDTVTGQFVDAAVSGLNYTCSSGATGVTNVDGEFTCNTGDTVTFYIGTYEIGSATAQMVITPYTLEPEDQEAAINIAQLLQTMDSDGDLAIIRLPLEAIDEAERNLEEWKRINKSEGCIICSRHQDSFVISNLEISELQAKALDLMAQHFEETGYGQHPIPTDAQAVLDRVKEYIL